MSTFKIVRQTPEAIRVEHIASGEVFPFIALRLGDDGDRILAHAPEARGKERLQASTGDLFNQAHAFAEAAMLKAGAINRGGPPQASA